jgi:hypothetical protein
MTKRERRQAHLKAEKAKQATEEKFGAAEEFSTIYMGRVNSHEVGKGCDIHPEYKGDMYILGTKGKIPLLMCVTMCAPRVLHKMLRDYTRFYTALLGPLSVPWSYYNNDPKQAAGSEVVEVKAEVVKGAEA